jgi:signal transduction histidine kinase
MRDAAGDVVGILSHATDVSEQVATRLEVERKADELRELTTQLEHSSVDNAKLREHAEHALAAAEEANRAKGEFLARMSHDLRTPLNAIGGYTELIEMQLYGSVTEQQLDALRRIRRAQEHLLTLINDILSFARLEAGQVSVTIEPVSVNAVFNEVAELTRPELDGRKLQVSFDPGATPLSVRADRGRLIQVLLNLVSNAIKFTDEGWVRISAEETSDGRVALRVADTGRGIPRGRLDAIFEPFIQVRPHKGEDRGGVGLGLAITRELMRLMHGELSVESEVDRGSTFTVKLEGATASS